MPDHALTAYYEPMALALDQPYDIDHVHYEAGAEHPCFMHFHECAEIIFFESVEGELQTPSGNRKLRPGSLCISGPFAQHHYQLSHKAKRWYILKISPDESAGLARLSELSDTSLAHLNPVHANRLAELMSWLHTEPNRSYSSALLALIIAFCLDQSDDAKQLSHKENPGKLAPLVQALRASKLNFSQKQAAELCCVSESYFCRLFKLTFKTTYNHYLHEYRLRTALTLLGQGRTTTDIALSLGYASSSHFISKFKEQFGVTPSKWIKEKSGAG